MGTRSRAGDLVLALPDGEFHTDAALLEQCYLLFALSGFRVVPNPLEVLALPAGYVDDLLKFAQGVRFFEDMERRPAEMREMASTTQDTENTEKRKGAKQ